MRGGLHPPLLIGYASKLGMQNKARFEERESRIHAFEYMVGLFTVIIGLAVVDLAASFHKLARHRRSVTWDPPRAARGALLAAPRHYNVVRNLGNPGRALDRGISSSYLTICAEYFRLFLVAAASLPDDPIVSLDVVYES